MTPGTREQRMKALDQAADLADEIACRTTDQMVSALARCVVVIANVSRIELERLDHLGSENAKEGT